MDYSVDGFVVCLAEPKFGAVTLNDVRGVWSLIAAIFVAIVVAIALHWSRWRDLRQSVNEGTMGSFRRGDGVRWRTIAGGSRVYVDALARRVRGRIALATPVLGVTPTGYGVDVRNAGGETDFDRAVLAVHADTALSLLTAPTIEQRRVLGAIRYSLNETVLHTDTSLLPRRPAARASWNYIVPRGRASERVLVSYDLSRLQSIPSAEPLLVTLNGSSRIAADAGARPLRLRPPDPRCRRDRRPA